MLTRSSPSDGLDSSNRALRVSCDNSVKMANKGWPPWYVYIASPDHSHIPSPSSYCLFVWFNLSFHIYFILDISFPHLGDVILIFVSGLCCHPSCSCCSSTSISPSRFQKMCEWCHRSLLLGWLRYFNQLLWYRSGYWSYSRVLVRHSKRDCGSWWRWKNCFDSEWNYSRSHNHRGLGR